jgi:hypothetical protein
MSAEVEERVRRALAGRAAAITPERLQPAVPPTATAVRRSWHTWWRPLLAVATVLAAAVFAVRLEHEPPPRPAPNPPAATVPSTPAPRPTVSPTPSAAPTALPVPTSARQPAGPARVPTRPRVTPSDGSPPGPRAAPTAPATSPRVAR